MAGGQLEDLLGQSLSSRVRDFNCTFPIREFRVGHVFVGIMCGPDYVLVEARKLASIAEY